ncbi:MAG: pro-sigmaK processing inhibitor BofA family protein [Clostridia bacterium]|nr:pro-sigmaK processing inhibitor BofA family protein [Clostridia bacterium]
MASIISWVLTAIAIVVIIKILTMPLKLIMKLVINSIVGIILLVICNFLGIGIVLNAWIIGLTVLFGVPGFFIALIITTFIL